MFPFYPNTIVAPKANCRTIGFGSNLQRKTTMEDRHMIKMISVAFVLASSRRHRHRQCHLRLSSSRTA